MGSRKKDGPTRRRHTAIESTTIRHEVPKCSASARSHTDTSCCCPVGQELFFLILFRVAPHTFLLLGLPQQHTFFSSLLFSSMASDGRSENSCRKNFHCPPKCHFSGPDRVSHGRTSSFPTEARSGAPEVPKFVGTFRNIHLIVGSVFAAYFHKEFVHFGFVNILCSSPHY